MIHFEYFAVVLLLCAAQVAAGVGGSVNLTNFSQHRQKRFLTFENGGNLKFVVGPVLPLPFEDPIPWRTLVFIYNLQGLQYDLPSTPLYPWDKWEGIFTRALHSNSARLNQRREDDTRLFVYTALEAFLDRRNGGHGRTCLLRAICENAQVFQHVGIFSEVLDIVLTPGKESLDYAYQQARQAGHAGADCLRLYAACPRGANFLDQYLHDF